MNKNQLVDAIYSRMQKEKKSVNKQDVEFILNACLSSIEDALKKKEIVRLVKFGTFSTAERKARKGRNPSTGKEILIGKRKVVKFSVGKGLKDAVN